MNRQVNEHQAPCWRLHMQRGGQCGTCLHGPAVGPGEEKLEMPNDEWQ